MLFIFLVLLVGPVLVKNFDIISIDKMFSNGMRKDLFNLIQPTSSNNNDTTSGVTGACIQSPCPQRDGGAGEAAETGSSDSTARRMLAF